MYHETEQFCKQRPCEWYMNVHLKGNYQVTHTQLETAMND